MWDTTLVEFDKYENFQKCDVHMSTNSQKFEIACFRRFFCLEKWMKEKK
jgi:hypothetical protein